MSARSRWTALVCGAMLVLAASAGTVAAADETEVALEPADQSVDRGAVATVDVVVTDAQGGVGSFDLVATVEDSSVAEVANVTYADEPAYTHQPGDDHSAQLAATGVDTPNGGAVTVATVELEATGTGTTDLSLSVSDVADESGRSYDVTGTDGATLSVSAPDDRDDDGSDDEDDNSDEDDRDDSSDDDESDSGESDDDSDEQPTDDGPSDDDSSPPTDGDDSGEGGNQPDDDARAPDEPDDGDDGTSVAVLAVVVAALAVLAVGVGVHLYRR